MGFLRFDVFPDSGFRGRGFAFWVRGFALEVQGFREFAFGVRAFALGVFGFRVRGSVFSLFGVMGSGFPSSS